MAWKRIRPSKGSRMGSLARVTMSIEKKGVKTAKAASLAVRVVIAADIARRLGWTPKLRVVVDQDDEARLLRISAAPQGETESFSLMGASKRNVGGAKCDTVGLRFSLLTLGVTSPRDWTTPETVEHQFDDEGGLVITPPGWAWNDWTPPPPAKSGKPAQGEGRALPLQPSGAPAVSPGAPFSAPGRSALAAAPAVLAAPAARVDAGSPRAPLVKLPLDEDFPKNLIIPTPPLDEQLEAEDLLRKGKGARYVADEYGWPLRWCQAYADRLRWALAEQRNGKVA